MPAGLKNFVFGSGPGLSHAHKNFWSSLGYIYKISDQLLLKKTNFITHHRPDLHKIAGRVNQRGIRSGTGMGISAIASHCGNDPMTNGI